MSRQLVVEMERFPIAGSFTIARGTKTEAQVVTCRIVEYDPHGRQYAGRGECVPYGRYGETIDGVMAAIEAQRGAIENGMDRGGLQAAMPAGAARNALDCALWDLEAKMGGRPVAAALAPRAPRPLITAYTISLGEPEQMAAQARAAAQRPLLKVKMGTANDASRIQAVARAAPNSRIILDANEGWTEENLRMHLLAAAEFQVALVEQPLPAGKDTILAHIPHPVPICADESVHGLEGLEDLASRYDAVNIKLDKTGGLTEALRLRERAREIGFGVMVGCMVGTSLAMAPAVLLAQDADYVDLDGPLLLQKDRSPALVYNGSLVSPPEPALWG